MTAALKSLNFTTLRKLSTIQRSIVTYVVARLEEQKPLLADPISRDQYLVGKTKLGRYRSSNRSGVSCRGGHHSRVGVRSGYPPDVANEFFCLKNTFQTITRSVGLNVEWN
jgi:hypothetical protein